MRMHRTTDKTTLLNTANWITMGLAVACVGLFLATIAYLWMQRFDRGLDTALQDPQLRQEVIEQLVTENPSIFDSHADPDVGRINQPYLKDQYGISGMVLSTNRFGIRERNYALPKPAGLVRIVLLGDSMIFGTGVPAEDRVGVHLERWLAERSPDFDGQIECLHLAVPSWNIKAESSYLLRQMSDLQPDLVIHVSVPNDLHDCSGLRGFGVPAKFSPQQRHRADSIISYGWPGSLGFSRASGLLPWGIDWEGQIRFGDAAADILRLTRTLERFGAKYRLLLAWNRYLPVAKKLLVPRLDPAQVVYLPTAFRRDPQYWVSEENHHWNREGHMKVARLIYAMIVRDRLLENIAPLSWEEAAQTFDEIAIAGREEAERELKRSHRVEPAIDLTDLTARTARQIHGGIDEHGYLSPYSSFVLKNADGRRLEVQGLALDRPELDSTRVRVFVDAVQIGEIELLANRELDLSYPLPAIVAHRPFLNVRFESDDYVYQGPFLQHCVVFQLKRLAIAS